jgi:hypothetical protein
MSLSQRMESRPLNPFSIAPICLALLAILQKQPKLKHNYPIETRRECGIQALEVDIAQQCHEWSIAGDYPSYCRSSTGIRQRAEQIIDSYIQLKEAK